MDLSFDLLETITNKFSDEQKVGSGGHGDVYRAMYNGHEIAVKRIHQLERIDDEMFLNDFDNLSKIHHPNLVQLIGCCFESRRMFTEHCGELLTVHHLERIVCSEFICGGSLHKYISDGPCGLDWTTCYKIIKGTCEGLYHLHTYYQKPIYHLGLKPANILLDKNMTAKISDLAMRKLCSSAYCSEIMEGKGGYKPPEYIDTGYISSKFDVFSLGVIIIKMMAGDTGYFLHYETPYEKFIWLVTESWKKRLQSTTISPSVQEIDILRVKTCVEIALRCVQHDRRRRPSIKDIIDGLEQLEANIKKMDLIGQNGKYTIEFNLPEGILSESGTPINLELPFLQSITENFSDELKIGNGGCAVVYKGILRNGNAAVKRFLRNHLIKDDRMFRQEVESMMMVNHKNVVRCLGYCSHTTEQAVEVDGKFRMAEVRERLLCLEYISNGSLDKYITDELRGLQWHTRYQIIQGICDGLDHLHKKHIMHMDLKPANILLDNDMFPKITDFGISRFDDKSQTTSSDRLMSLGYCAPEYQHHGKMTPKSDIYSLGVIILELVTGAKEKPNNNDVHRRWNYRWNKSANDAQLGYKQVATCLNLVERCTKDEPTDRPNISDIIDELNMVSRKEEDSGALRISDATECLELKKMLGIEPLEIQLPYELNKQISCSVELSNDTDGYFAFRISTTSFRPYCIWANRGTLPPWSKCWVTITLQTSEEALPDHQSRDEFSVLSARVDGDIGGEIFSNKEAGKMVDKARLTIVLTS